MNTILSLPRPLASLLALAALLLPAFVSAADPVPFPPDPDTAAIADGATLPKLVRRVEPVAPVESAPRGYELWVYVAFVVNDRGGVEKASAMFEPPAPFAQAALDAVRQWEFQPGLHPFGPEKTLHPVNSQMTVKFVFPATPSAETKR